MLGLSSFFFGIAIGRERHNKGLGSEKIATSGDRRNRK
jgi:hypothetical protein